MTAGGPDLTIPKRLGAPGPALGTWDGLSIGRLVRVRLLELRWLWQPPDRGRLGHTLREESAADQLGAMNGSVNGSNISGAGGPSPATRLAAYYAAFSTTSLLYF